MQNFISQSNIFLILLIFAVSLFVLSKSANKFVDNAVVLSSIWGMPKIIIGATVVSLGTTLPELISSVIGAINGNVGFAVGNAVGSIITNTSIIFGTAALFGKVYVREDSKKKFNILVLVCVILIIPSFISKFGKTDGTLPQILGFIFLLLLPVYIVILIRQNKNNPNAFSCDNINLQKSAKTPKASITVIIIILFAFLLSISASGLVASSVAIAQRLGVSDIVISSTLVAFGTSVPEFSTAIASVKKNHGDLCLGNILGADILNVLLVLGASLCVSTNGMIIPQSFYLIHIPSLILVLFTFGYCVYNKNLNILTKKISLLLIALYVLYLLVNLKDLF
ncbi:MAG: sodium:calcium antiporter [Eubacteriaceae bacterium]|nr:sodium:calcium antiporter [Eubacteriaceae bacterium]